MLLQTDLYKKGVFVGKQSEKFKSVISSYSTLANSLSGSQINGLYDFCETYNEHVRVTMQRQILRKEAISFEEFDQPQTVDEGVVNLPLKIKDSKVLKRQGYTKSQIDSIKKAKNIKVKGINVNILLSSNDVSDATNLGHDEKQLQIRQLVSSAIKYLFTTLLLSFIAIKNIEDWGWVGLLLTIFKVAYLFAGSYMSYFKGYDNVTIDLLNHFTRKMDILKMYLDYKSDEIVEHLHETI